jgi:hypothetical protein
MLWGMVMCGLLLLWMETGPVPHGGARLAGQLVGVTLGIPANEENTLAQELKTKEERLAAQERELARKSGEAGGESGSLLMLELAVAALAILMGVNFVLDYRRRRREKA